MSGGKIQRQKAHQKIVERGNLRRTTLEVFGRHLLSNVPDGADPNEFDWEEFIKDFIRNRMNNKGSRPGLMYINWTVSTHFGYDAYLVRSNTRVRKITKVKHTAMYLAVTLFKYKYDDLQDFYDISNHASIVNAMDVARNYLFTEKEYREDIHLLTDKLLGYGRNDIEINEGRDTEEST